MRKPVRKDPGVNPKAHPLIKALALAVYAEGYTHSEVCRVAGVHKDTWQKYRREGRCAQLRNIETIAQVVGLRLTLKPIHEENSDEERKNVKTRRKDRG